MADRSAEPWYPTAAYLYVLHLDGPALAWEYLRRHPDYRHDWLRQRRRPDTVQHWGLRLLEDPALDAREAHPAWFPDHETVVQLHPDPDPPPQAETFAFWGIPGRKSLVHDGRRLVLTACGPRQCLRFALASGLAEGMACLQAAPPGKARRTRADMRDRWTDVATPAAMACARPTSASLLELHTLQALDAALAGASLREIAEGLFGADAVDADWHADGDLRARVRRLARRGNALMRGGYRRLAQLPSPEKGRSAVHAERP